MAAPPIIIELIERFEQNLEAYRSGQYKEQQLRQEFINPFFKALGWDVYNTAGYAEAYKDVIHEDAIKIGSASKAPDYSFRIGGTRKFFVEAKKPSVNIAEDIGPAYQLRRYAWSAKLPLSILTDFEEFAVYDSRIKPDKSDKAATARIMYLNYKDYPSRWEEIASIFSKEAVMKGSFDKYAETTKVKKGTAGVDAAFLAEIDAWRQSLAQNIALRNSKLTQRELNFAVGKTIDRIIFLRICEDRGIEPYGQLMALQNGANVYQRLIEIYYDADDKYNSGLFHFKEEKERFEPPDDLTLSLAIDDKVLKDIFKSLYYPESPYEFSVLPADILGHVYEQFLGKVIHLTPGHRARVEEKPEVRKAGGVYYTPTYIVDYIVKNTVGKLLEGKNPKTAEQLRILDPACGSGSFLIGAYQYLLDWHRDKYVEDNPEKHAKGKNPKLYQKIRNEWRLTTTERKRILLNNIYGVDIDPQAVEVTKLSLLLKVLEGEDEETIKSAFQLFRERALPDLGNNIKCGNSLIGPDFYEGKQMNLLDSEEAKRVNIFNWHAEFPEIFKADGFDAVIGNPPYVLIGSDKPDEQLYYRNKFHFNVYKINTYILFLEKGLNLLRHAGILGFIIPKSLVFNIYFNTTRNSLVSNYAIPQIVEIRDKVFANAEVGDSILFFASVSNISSKNMLNYYKVKNIWPDFLILKHYKTLQQNLLEKSETNFFETEISLKVPAIPLGNITEISNGLNPGNVRHILFSNSKESKNHNELVLGRDIQKYFLSWSGTWVNYDFSLKEKVKITDVKSKSGMTAQKRVDFALRNPAIFKPNKILVRKTADHIIASYDAFGYYFDSLAYSVQMMATNKIQKYLFYILGLLNSKFLNHIHNSLSLNKDKVFAKVLAENLRKLPIRSIDFNKPDEKKLYDNMVQLVEQMLSLNKQLTEAKTGHEQTLLQRQIDATDKQIDKLVYELYGLTEEEIKIVES
ncbi:MAG: N-6 DNA methylase [Syntrophaceae bacterium]|nr:N-6 DNA methylase [Syntrophaceae bacterium]